jgi:hypothetical protein
LDTLSWARRGALVSGLDFSPPAIEAASSLAAELGIEATFVVSDVYDAVAAFGDYPYTYTDGHPLEHSRNVQFQHGIGEVTTALVDAGLRIEFLHEYEFDAFRRFAALQRQDDETYWFPAGRPRVPMMFSVRASFDGTGER